MINWHNFKCKECKRGYKQINSFLVNGYCIPCIREVMRLRSIGIFTDTDRRAYLARQKVKGKQVYQNLKGIQLQPAQKNNFQKIQKNLKKQNEQDQTIATY